MNYFECALTDANCCFLVAVHKKTAKRNILGTAQAKHNKNDKIIALTLPALKNSNQWTMVTECGSGRTWWAMEWWEREVRGQGKDEVGGRSVLDSRSQSLTVHGVRGIRRRVRA